MPTVLLGEHEDFFSIWTFVHFFVGLIVGLLGVVFVIWAMLMVLFEFWENSPHGIAWFNQPSTNTIGAPYYESGEYIGDHPGNSVWDVIAGSSGWVVGNWIRQKLQEWSDETNRKIDIKQKVKIREIKRKNRRGKCYI